MSRLAAGLAELGEEIIRGREFAGFLLSNSLLTLLHCLPFMRFAQLNGFLLTEPCVFALGEFELPCDARQLGELCVLQFLLLVELLDSLHYLLLLRIDNSLCSPRSLGGKWDLGEVVTHPVHFVVDELPFARFALVCFHILLKMLLLNFRLSLGFIDVVSGGVEVADLDCSGIVRVKLLCHLRYSF